MIKAFYSCLTEAEQRLYDEITHSLFEEITDEFVETVSDIENKAFTRYIVAAKENKIDIMADLTEALNEYTRAGFEEYCKNGLQEWRSIGKSAAEILELKQNVLNYESSYSYLAYINAHLGWFYSAFCEIYQDNGATFEKLIEEKVKTDYNVTEITYNGEIYSYEETPEENQLEGQIYFDLSPLSEPAKGTTTHRLRDIIMPRSKVNNKYFDGSIRYGSENIPVNVGRKNKKQILNYCSLLFNDDPGVKVPASLDEYDEMLHSIITSYVVKGINEISPRMIYRAMTGNPDAQPTPQRVNEIRKHMRKLMSSLVVIDVSEDAAAKSNLINLGYEPHRDKAEIEGNIIHAERCKLVINGQEVEGYKILRKPVLYEYSCLKGGIEHISAELLNAPDIDKTEDTIRLEAYLLKQIFRIKAGGNGNTIKYDSIYKNFDKTENNDTKKKRIREKTNKLLDHFKKQGYIKNFETISQGKTRHYSIRIDMC